MKIPNKRVLQQIAFNHSSDIDFKYFMKLYKKCTAKPYMLSRKIINIYNNIARKYGNIIVQDFRKYEKLHYKKNKLKLDIDFLNNCKQLGAYRKFLIFKLPNVSNKDAVSVRKRLHRSAIDKRNKELQHVSKYLSLSENFFI